MILDADAEWDEKLFLAGETRRCLSCNVEQDITEFYKSGPKAKPMHIQKPLNVCQACRLQTQNKASRDRATGWKVHYSGGKCKNCGEDFSNYQACLHFHHLDPSTKTAEPSKLIRKAGYRSSSKTADKIRTELELCILVCANCHIKIHQDLQQERERININPQQFNSNKEN